MKRTNDLRAQKYGRTMLSILFTLVSIFYIFPVVMVLINSFKVNTLLKRKPLLCPPEKALPALITSLRA